MSGVGRPVTSLHPQSLVIDELLDTGLGEFPTVIGLAESAEGDPKMC